MRVELLVLDDERAVIKLELPSRRPRPGERMTFNADDGSHAYRYLGRLC